MGILLVMKTSDGRERPFKIEKHRTVIGRATRCDVRIPISAVSGQHCEIRFTDGKLELNDLNSVSGTYHNGERVNQAILTDKDTLRIGPVTFEIRMQSGAKRGEETIEILRKLPEGTSEGVEA